MSKNIMILLSAKGILECSKKLSILTQIANASNLKKFSYQILCKIKGPNYLDHKSAQKLYLLYNPKVSMGKGMNAYILQVFNFNLIFAYCCC